MLACLCKPPFPAPMRRSTLTFHWAIAVEGAIREEDVHVRADHASERGVLLPEGWRVALSAYDLGSRAAEACQNLELGDGVSELACSVAGKAFGAFHKEMWCADAQC